VDCGFEDLGCAFSGEMGCDWGCGDGGAVGWSAGGRDWGLARVDCGCDCCCWT